MQSTDLLVNSDLQINVKSFDKSWQFSHSILFEKSFILAWHGEVYSMMASIVPGWGFCSGHSPAGAQNTQKSSIHIRGGGSGPRGVRSYFLAKFGYLTPGTSYPSVFM